jgi:hypothetical protein
VKQPSLEATGRRRLGVCSCEHTERGHLHVEVIGRDTLEL